MKKIEKGIVFSNDIERILKGKNGLEFSYQNKGLTIPSSSFLETLRSDFKSDVNKIFENKVTVISEEDMLNSIYNVISDVFGRVPHYIT